MNYTETPKTANFRHRLYVILPLFLVLGWAGVGGHQTASVTGSVLSQSGAITTVDNGRLAIDGGMVIANDTVSIQGSSMVAGKSLIAVTAGAYALEGWNGVFTVDSTVSGPLTVAALTTPVLVRQNGDAWLVPVGMQLTIPPSADASPAVFIDWVKSRRPLPLPVHYLREQLPRAETLLEKTSVQALMVEPAFVDPLAGSALMFDAARVDAEKQDRSERVAELSTMLMQHHLAAFDVMMGESQTGEALSHAHSSELLTLLSLAIGEKRDVQMLPFVLRDPEMTVLLRFHPLLRDRVWLTAEAASDHTLLLLGQMLLPLSDYDEISVSAMSVRTWEDGWKALHADGSVVDALAPMIADDIIALDDAGYPVRAKAYAAAFASGVHPLPEGLSDAAKSAFDHLRSLYDILVSIADPLIEQSASIPESMAAFSSSSDERTSVILPESDVRSMLSEKGCMFTSQSILKKQDTGVYAIENVVIGTGGGDRSISFTFDPATGLVSAIEKNGQILPYSLTLERYLEWVKGE